ncbi:transglycosylase SLT domain-containing protein [Salmonella enterica subsp. enterica serovar Give]|uniref:transglycosylase SLT domain-containing protein n=1 Tax=Salmonella enterica TaxID=28901 RepID=UPI0009ABF5DC|nr:transglycosylase SLT domain-containing protein [Salmonella enterica]EAT1655943.1 lytic transglycosylase [Salmonella enterica subsp. enterica serovar Meleagridis]EAW2464119.1 lytic transglycosylase [Salmonella enterica subsp. enterica]EBC9785223.1 lytic transglycosylase [Salmonella enterica subsp. enterica serovar Give]ECS6640412.1 lytic transglycosylase [Salmonella enterica subsp. enterica serovar Agona]EDS6232894.1 transglycosylase SLT domain-containing protein [Salmonella enterica subsp. 
MNAETIKDFLVSLGFGIDEAGYEKFESVLADVTANAIKTGLAVEGAALSVVAFTAKIASGLDNLYWASQRTGATVQGIQSIGYAVSQVGGSVDAARSSLESLSRFVRNNPGAEGFLNRLGVQTRDASGNMRDMATIFTGVGQKLSSMPYYRANQYAQMLGIDENTLMAMRRGVGSFSGQYSAMAKAIGFIADEAARSSNKFMTSLREFGTMAGMARDKIGSNLAGGLAGSLDMLRRHILDNFPRIEQTLTKAIKGILTLGDIIGRLFFRLIEGTSSLITWWQSLDKQTRELISLFGALTIALRILNSTFWMSPIGLITALAAGIALLWEDYQTWKEGGDSLIDWGKWKPEVDAALNMVRDLKTTVNDLAKALAKLLNIDPKSWSLKWDFSNFIDQMGEFSKMLNMIADLLNAIKDGRWADAASIGKRMLNQGSENPSAMPMVTDSANSTADWIKEHWGFDPRSVGRTVLGWFGSDDPEQHGQSVKRPQPTKAGAELLGWMQPMLTNLEHLYRLPEGLLRSVAITESGGNQFAVSGAGAKGLFQFMDGTARDMGLRGNDVFDPEKAAQAAAKYLSQLLRANGGDLSKALASYNWGIGNVQKHGMALMPQETRNYIPRVLSNMPGRGTQVQQQNTYHIYGGGDPRQVGSEVERRQQSANAQVMRGNQTKVG